MRPVTNQPPPLYPRLLEARATEARLRRRDFHRGLRSILFAIGFALPLLLALLIWPAQ